MTTFSKIVKILAQQFSHMRWHVIVLALIVYSISSWLLLYLAGEEHLLNQADFFYWLIVTGSTVGYGDLSPQTTAGKYLVALYIIPFGLSIFAFVIGRVAAWVSQQWQKRTKGMKDLQLENHILLIGWNGERTKHLLRLLLREQMDIDNPRPIALCVRVELENPMPDKIDFVKVNSFNQDRDMDRACIADASVIIIDNPDDDLTMTTSLYASFRNPDGHILAYFTDESLVHLLQQHCPNVECMPSVAVEMLAKSAFDPGSSMLHHDLLSVQEGQAQFSVRLPEGSPTFTVAQVFNGLKQKYDATFIGMTRAESPKKIELNPKLDDELNALDNIYYIAHTRIKQIDWGDMYV